MAAPVTHIQAREILDSRGNPTLEVTLEAGGAIGSFAVPAGASTGTHEALDRRDGDARFGGMGVRRAIESIEREISPALRGIDAYDQERIDRTMLALDGTETKARLGGNAMIGVSIAAARAAAQHAGKPLFAYLPALASIEASRSVPYLYMNLINGGKHAATKLAFQEYHVVPHADSIEAALEIGTAMMRAVRQRIIGELGPQSANIGDEGGYVPDTDAVEKPLELFAACAEGLGLTDKVTFALDVAASSFYENGAYNIGGRAVSTDELGAIYGSLLGRFPIRSIEDPFHEDDFASFATLTETGATLVVGDDLTVTNPKRLAAAIEKKSVSALIVKPNQVGTLTETLACMRLARTQGIECIVSHRSGETNDTFIADLAFAFGCYGIKAGAPQRGERVAKYNRLWDIHARRS